MTLFHETLFEVPGYRVANLQPEDTAALQALLGKSSDYSHLVTGLPPAPSAACSLLTDCPEGKSQRDKLDIGIFTERQELIGILDVVRDYPAQGDWWLGLLLLDPAYRGQGWGQRIYEAFEKWVAQQGVQRIWLGVVAQNRGAYRFWQKAGFKPLNRQHARHIGNKEHVVITMAIPLKR